MDLGICSLSGVAFLFPHWYNLLFLNCPDQIYCENSPMNSEKPGIADRLKSIFSIGIFIILVLGVGFLSVNFILALYGKFS
jgi:hypothetical protein